MKVAILTGAFLMALAIVSHGWWGFLFLPLAMLVAACVREAYA